MRSLGSITIMQDACRNPAFTVALLGLLVISMLACGSYVRSGSEPHCLETACSLSDVLGITLHSPPCELTSVSMRPATRIHAQEAAEVVFNGR